MFLTGTYERSLDEKRRLPLPKPLRAALEEAVKRPLFCAPGLDGAIAIYPEKAFADLAQKMGEGSPAAPQVRDYHRLFFARAEAARVDAQGRIRIPQGLAEWAGLRGEAVLIGVRDHIELWDKQAWEKYAAERADQFDALAEAALRGSD